MAFTETKHPEGVDRYGNEDEENVECSQSHEELVEGVFSQVLGRQNDGNGRDVGEQTNDAEGIEEHPRKPPLHGAVHWLVMLRNCTRL